MRTRLIGVPRNLKGFVQTVASALRLDQFAAPTASVSLGSQKITNLADGSSAQDATTYTQVATALGAYVLRSLYDAHTILYATTDDTPAALTVGASTFVGRKASGNISAMSAAEAATVLALASTNISDFTEAAQDVVGAMVTAGTGITATYSDAGGTETISATTMPINSQSGTTYTTVAGDAGKVVELTSASAVTVTIPNSIHAANDVISFCQYGAGQVTIAAGSGFTLRSSGGKTKTAAQYGVASIFFRSASEGVLGGDLST